MNENEKVIRIDYKMKIDIDLFKLLKNRALQESCYMNRMIENLIKLGLIAQDKEKEKENN